MSRRAIAYTILLLVIIISITGIALLHKSNGCRNFRVLSVCPTTSLLMINTTGSCSSVRIELVDSDGITRASLVAPVGHSTSLNITPGIPPGNYTMKVYHKGRIIGEYIIKVYRAPFITHARALVMPNGTITVTFHAYSPPCMRDYGLSAVIVLVNGTRHTFTGHWVQGQDIRLNIGVLITPKTTIKVIVVDSLGNYYNAGVARPI